MKLYESGEYRSTKDWPYAISAGTVVYRRNENGTRVLLLVRRAGSTPDLPENDHDTYHLPKGHVNTGESLEQTALRETAEEVGCKVDLRTYLGASHHRYLDKARAIEVDKTIHYFAGLFVEDAGTMDNEHSDRVWKPIDEAVQLLSDDNPKNEQEIVQRLKKFLELDA